MIEPLIVHRFDITLSHLSTESAFREATQIAKEFLRERDSESNPYKFSLYLKSTSQIYYDFGDDISYVYHFELAG